jgi:ankyrin repeat protein
MVKLLLENKIPFSPSYDIQQIFFKTLRNNHLEMLKLLIKNGVNLNKSRIVNVGHSKFIPVLRDSIKINDIIYSCKIYEFPLDVAIKHGNLQSILCILDQGAEGLQLIQDRIKASIQTPLHLAIYLNNPQIVAILLANQVNYWSDSAFYLVKNTTTMLKITATEYARRLKDNVNRDEIIAMINQPVSLKSLASIQLLRDNNLTELQQFFANLSVFAEIASFFKR